MTKAFPRGLKSPNLDSRRATASRVERARDDWRAGVRDIGDGGEEERDNYDAEIDPRDDDPLDAVSRRIERSRARAPEPRRNRDAQRDEAPSRRARDSDFDQRESRGRSEQILDPDEIAESAAALITRRVAKSERQTAKALENIAELIENGHRRVDPEVIDGAVAAIERRVGETEKKTAKALENLAQLIEAGAKARARDPDDLDVVVDRLGRIESRIAQQPEPASVRPIRGALARLEARIDRLSNDGRANNFEQALSGLDQRLAEIAARLDGDARERQAARSTLNGPSRAAIDHVLDRAPPQEARHDVERVEPAPRAKRPLADAITDIARRQRSLDEETLPPEHGPRRAEPLGPDTALAVKRLDELHASVDALSRRFETWQNGVGDRSDQLLVLMRQIETLHRQIDETSRGEHPAVAGRFDDLRGQVEGLSGLMESVRDDAAQRSDQQYVIVRQVEELREEIDGLSRALGDLAPRASVTAIESALRDLARRIDSQRDRGVDDSALAPAERIAGELRAAMKDLDPAPLVRNLHEDLRAIASRLDELQTPGKTDATALNELGRQTGEIKELLSALASRPLPLEKLETRLFDLTQRVERLSVGAAQGAGGKDIGEVVKTIRSIVATETNNGLQGFNRQLEHLSVKLDESLAKFGGKRFDELGARIDDMHKSLARRIDHGVAARKDTGALENLVATLAKKIDAALDAKAHLSAFDELGRKIEKLEARIQDPAGAQSIARIERLLATPEGHFAELTQRIDQIGKTLTSRLQQDSLANNGSEHANIEKMVRRLGERIDAALEPGANRRDIEQLEQQIELVSKKLDRLADSSATAKIEQLLAQPNQDKQLHEISDRLDFMHNALAASIEEGVRARTESSKAQLTDLVEALARKLNSALAPNADNGAMKALESQIKQLSARLDRNDGNGAVLASIEHKLGEVFGRIEEAGASSTEAAEAAVRRATLEALRQVGTSPAALDPVFKEELDDLRRAQEASGERTHETLAAVHETLERVVDRLAAFEDEITEIRGEDLATESSFESGPMRRGAQGAAEDAARNAARELARFKPTELKEDRAEPKLAAPPPRARRGQDVGDLDLDALSNAEPRVARGETAAQSDFIAAARRAALQAAADSDAVDASQKVRRAAEREAPQNTGAMDRVGATIAARKRPLLLGLAALVALVGLSQLAHHVTGAGGVAPIAHESPNSVSIGEPAQKSPPVAATVADAAGKRGRPTKRDVANRAARQTSAAATSGGPGQNPRARAFADRAGGRWSDHGAETQRKIGGQRAIGHHADRRDQRPRRLASGNGGDTQGAGAARRRVRSI